MGCKFHHLYWIVVPFHLRWDIPTGAIVRIPLIFTSYPPLPPSLLPPISPSQLPPNSSYILYFLTSQHIHIHAQPTMPNPTSHTLENVAKKLNSKQDQFKTQLHPPIISFVQANNDLLQVSITSPLQHFHVDSIVVPTVFFYERLQICPSPPPANGHSLLEKTSGLNLPNFCFQWSIVFIILIADHIICRTFRSQKSKRP